MKITLSRYDFVQRFADCGRAEQFSRPALHALFDYLEELDDDYELDVVGICCEFAEYETAMEAATEYGHDAEDEEAAMEYLENNTTVIPFSGGIVIGQF